MSWMRFNKPYKGIIIPLDSRKRKATLSFKAYECSRRNFSIMTLWNKTALNGSYYKT